MLLRVRKAHQVLELTKIVIILAASFQRRRLDLPRTEKGTDGTGIMANRNPRSHLRRTPLPQRSSDREPFCFRPMRPSSVDSTSMSDWRSTQDGLGLGAPCELSIVAGCGSSMSRCPIRLRWLRHGAVGRGDALAGFHLGSKILLEDHQRTERDLADRDSLACGDRYSSLQLVRASRPQGTHRETMGRPGAGRRLPCTPGSEPEEAMAHTQVHTLTYPASVQQRVTGRVCLKYTRNPCKGSSRSCGLLVLVAAAEDHWFCIFCRDQSKCPCLRQ